MPNPPSSGLPNPQSYTVTMDTVLDNVTGLVWQRNVETPPANAQAYCDGLTLGGSTDWRVPRAIDLMSIIDFSRDTPAVDPSAFPTVPPTVFWSSTVALLGNISVSLGSGGAGSGTGGYVMCVSGGHPPPASSHYTVANATVRDNWTGLTWQQHLGPTSFDFSQAPLYCGGLALDGAGWRVPSLNEIESLVARGPTALPGGLDPESFPDISGVDQFWTSSPVFGSSGNAWMVKFIYGGSTWSQPTWATNGVRCVR